MKVTYDPAKNARNVKLRGLSFDEAKNFDFKTAMKWEDTRKDYGEVRYRAVGQIGNRLYHLVYTPRGDTVRVISFRKANSREVEKYVDQT